MQRRNLMAVVCALALSLTGSAFGADTKADIVETAVAAGSFKTLVAAGQAAVMYDGTRVVGSATINRVSRR